MAEDDLCVYDAIVVGAGVIGSSTAYHLAKNGRRTLLLDQFSLPHTRGSSHGHSRTLRVGYTVQQSYYSTMTEESVALWRQLEEEAQNQIFNQTGVLYVALDPKNGEPAERSLQKCKFPMIRVRDNSTALLEPGGGVIYADKAVKSFQKVFEQNGGVIHDCERVLNIVPGDPVMVRTSRGEYRCRRLVLTVGAWARDMLKPLGLSLPLQPWRVSTFYWRLRRRCGLEADRCPIIRLLHAADGHNIYSVPCTEYPGMIKLSVHYGFDVDPDARDSVSDDWDLTACSRIIKQHLPDVEDTPAVIERCMYTMTPDSDFVLDRHPRFSHIVIGAGFSGHGFKMSPVTGKILCQLALDETPEFDMKPFKLTRFAAGKKYMFKSAI